MTCSFSTDFGIGYESLDIRKVVLVARRRVVAIWLQLLRLSAG
jgi:hypothetical protein